MKCPLCGSEHLELLAHRQSVPVLQNVICRNDEEAHQVPKGEIELYQCCSCEFVFNSAYRQVDYDVSYENYQGCSPLFSDYLDNEAQQVADYVNELNEDALLIEIGCGQGDFLKNVMRRVTTEHDIKGLGFDPAYRGEGKAEKCTFLPEYFTGGVDIKAYAGRQADHVICMARHVIEHIDDPHFLLGECEKIEAKTVDLFLETPDVCWIEQNEAFEDIVYEHCSFFNPASLSYLVRQHGFSVENFRHTFGGQYMWMMARRTPDTQSLAQSYHAHEKQMVSEWIERLSGRETTYVWGAGAKGVAFLNLLDPECKHVKGVIDINPKKQGQFLAGTGHPIEKPEVLRKERGTVQVIVMNENYLGEIRILLEQLGITNVILQTLRQ